jgi:hypothetical protein
MADWIDEAWTPLDELADLSSAATVEELHRRLVLLPAAGGDAADTFIPMALFNQFHGGNPEAAATTALLLVTDNRWRNATGRLIDAISSSGHVPSHHLDRLAESFLDSGAFLYWRSPHGWRLPEGMAPTVSQERQTVVVQRAVRPPLRRWAAARVVRAVPQRWTEMVLRAEELDARAGAAVMAGLLDAIDTLPPKSQRLLRAVGRRWPATAIRDRARADSRRTIKNVLEATIGIAGAPAPPAPRPMDVQPSLS